MKGYYVTLPDSVQGPFTESHLAFEWLYANGFERGSFTPMYVIPGHMTLAVDGRPDDYRVVIDYLDVAPAKAVVS